MLTKRLSGALCSAALLFGLSTAAVAADSRVYAGVDLGYALIEIEDQDFYPALARVSVGAWMVEGIGLELSHAAAISDDTHAGVNLEVSSVTAASVRLQSPEDYGVKAYALLGYTSFELEGTRSDTSYPGDEEFTGPMVGLGLLFPVRSTEPFSVAFEYSHHFADNDQDMGMLTAGIRYGF